MRNLDWKKWSFIPALLLMAGTALILNRMDPAQNWPTHYNFAGKADAFGGVRLLWPLLAQEFLITAMMFVMDEGLRQLRLRKWQFAGALATLNNAGIFFLLWQQYQAGPTGKTDHFFWNAMMFAGLMAAIAYVLEWLRQPLPPEPEAAMALPDFTERNFCYYEHCNPMWINILLLLPAGAMLLLPSGSGRFPVMPLVIAVVLMLFVGGFHVTVSRERFTVYFGLLKIKVLNLKLTGIKTAEVTDFNPVREFGGWGIRYGSKCGWGFILGSRGIKMVTARGRRITVSMRHPETALAIWQKGQ